MEDAAGLIAQELTRIERRWAELPIERAQSAGPSLRKLTQEYAALAHPGVAVPDLGPAGAVLQLRVMVHDALEDGVIPAREVLRALRALRHSLP